MRNDMKTTIEATIKLKINPFTVPSFVLVEEQPKERQGGFGEGRSYALSELDVETLESLCWKFKQEVFAKAGKQMHPTTACNTNFC